MNTKQKVLRELKNKGITLYRLSQMMNMRYELIRRTFNGNRTLTADELLLLLEKTGIDFEQIK